MPTFTSDFIEILVQRGFVHQATDLEKLDGLAKQQAITAYIGYDATADSLHVGSLVTIMLLRWLQKTGHRPLVLIGGGTTRIGDPSGKDNSRKLLDKATIENNILGIKKIFANFLTFGDAQNAATLVNNDKWLKELNYIDFLRDYGRHFSVNRMLSFESVRLRLDRRQPLSFLEFNYMILQAYDFLELARQYGCQLQIGGSDQWGNIVNGIDLARRIAGIELFGLTVPLLTKSSGEKMGKTASGAVWLNAEKLPAYSYWQFWRNTEDADLGRFLKLFTELPLGEIARLEALKGAEINEAKKILANEATKLCHGADAAKRAAISAEKTFEQGHYGADLPTLNISPQHLAQGVGLLEILTRLAFTKSNGEARRQVAGGAIKLNDKKIQDAFYRISAHDVGENNQIKLSMGKKKHAIITIS